MPAKTAGLYKAKKPAKMRKKIRKSKRTFGTVFPKPPKRK